VEVEGSAIRAGIKELLLRFFLTGRFKPMLAHIYAYIQ